MVTPGLPHSAIPSCWASPARGGLSPICLGDSGQDEWGEDTHPTETIKTMQPHKSPGMESVS